MKTIIEMARESNVLIFDRLNLITSDIDGLKRFAELVRADEREACAKVCEELERKATKQPPMVGQGCQACVIAIRARGNT